MEVNENEMQNTNKTESIEEELMIKSESNTKHKNFMKGKLTFIVLGAVLLIIIVILLLLSLLESEKKQKKFNPHKADWIDEDMIRALESVRRIDEKGFLYEMKMSGEYYNPKILRELNKEGYIDFGCSAFTTYNEKNEMLVCRNYDKLHKLTTDGSKVTGLNVLLRLSPEGKYKSINMADAIYIGESFIGGCLDDGITDISNLTLLPYECMDGMNEKGLTVSILLTDLKKGESPYREEKEGLKGIVYTVLMRYILDNCKTIEEAIELTKQYNIIPYKSGKNSHIFVTDSTGHSVVFEWRNKSFSVIETDAVTNFYLGYDDAEDHYNSKGVLIEKFSKLSNTYKNYSYGYGHGYYRFAGIISALQRYFIHDEKKYKTVMNEDVAKGILHQAAQDPGTEATSMTQYSVMYNINKLSLKVWVRQNYLKMFEFNFED